MMTLTFAFWLFIFIFASIGAMRGWAKEILVTVSVLLALFIIAVLEKWVPPVAAWLKSANGSMLFWTRAIIVVVLAFFGYQTPNIPKISGARFARERLSDTLLGFFLGALNGFIIVGTLWFYLHDAKYPYPNLIAAPDPKTPMGQAALHWIPLLVPSWLGVPGVFFAAIIAFLFVVVVFI